MLVQFFCVGGTVNLTIIKNINSWFHSSSYMFSLSNSKILIEYYDANWITAWISYVNIPQNISLMKIIVGKRYLHFTDLIWAFIERLTFIRLTSKSLYSSIYVELNMKRPINALVGYLLSIYSFSCIIVLLMPTRRAFLSFRWPSY